MEILKRETPVFLLKPRIGLIRSGYNMGENISPILQNS